MTDTVGFIRNMPKDLFAAFRATFEEAADADLLLEVVDASSPELDDHVQTTDGVIRQLGLDHIPRLVVKNKVDLLDPEQHQVITNAADCVGLCARDKATTIRLLARVSEMLGKAPTAPQNGDNPLAEAADTEACPEPSPLVSSIPPQSSVH